MNAFGNRIKESLKGLGVEKVWMRETEKNHQILALTMLSVSAFVACSKESYRKGDSSDQKTNSLSRKD
jgi:hypothetical protein